MSDTNNIFKELPFLMRFEMKIDFCPLRFRLLFIKRKRQSPKHPAQMHLPPLRLINSFIFRLKSVYWAHLFASLALWVPRNIPQILTHIWSVFDLHYLRTRPPAFSPVQGGTQLKSCHSIFFSCFANTSGLDREQESSVDVLTPTWILVSVGLVDCPDFILFQRCLAKVSSDRSASRIPVLKRLQSEREYF